jgi:protein-disulfide isomerase
MPDSLRIVVHQFPLREAHPLAFDAAVAAECGRRIGRFAAVHDALFAVSLTGDSLPVDSVAAIAGVHDVDGFRRCMRDSSARETINRELASAAAIGGIQGTPTLLFRDTLEIGGMPADSLLARLRGLRSE